MWKGVFNEAKQQYNEVRQQYQSRASPGSGGNTGSFPSPGFPQATPDAGAFGPGYQPSYAPPPQGYGSSSYSAPPGPPSSGYGPPAGSPYGGYAPPSGPPSSVGGYVPPSGPPPSAGGYAPPSGPPSIGSYAPPSGPPPTPYSSNIGYTPPSGPPPPNHSSRPINNGGYPGQQYHQQHPSTPNAGFGGSPRPGGYAPPSGPPPRPPTQQQYYGPQFENNQHQNVQPFFQYSQCSGKKKALCIGINYIGGQGELKGCINDARNIQQFLCRQWGYKPDDIVMLTDDSSNPRMIPTKENIIRGMQWLVNGAQPNDSLFFHYSGHGGQTKDLDGDEDDGYDEVIYPLDHETAGHILDDDMHDIMVKPLPAGCRLTAIYDSCHSGSALDLPYIYSTEGKVKEPNLAAEAGQGLLSAVTSYARGDMSGVFSSAMGIIKVATGNSQKATKKARATRTSPADVISWSGCKDVQTSADANEGGEATGAMSYAFVTALSQNSQQSYQQLLNVIRDILRSKYSQKPQLSSSHPMDTNIMFIC